MFTKIIVTIALTASIIGAAPAQAAAPTAPAAAVQVVAVNGAIGSLAGN